VVTFDPVVLVLGGVVQRGGTKSSITFANAGARSVMTSPGSPWAVRAVVKKMRAEVMSLRWDTYTSMT